MPPFGLSQIGGLTLYTFSPSQLGVFAQAVDGGFQPISSTEVLAASGAVAALDGPMFKNCSGQHLPSGNAAYPLSQCGFPEFLVYDSAGVSRASDRPNDGITVSIANNRATVTRGDGIAPGARVAVQLFPALLLDGNVVVSNTGSNANDERRAALAVFPDRLAFVVGANDMVAFAEAIKRLGATAAGYTDGGGSTSLVTSQGYYGASEHRRVPTWLVARGAGALPGIIAGLITAGIVGGLLYATTRLNVRRNPPEEEASEQVFELSNGDKLFVLPIYRGRPPGSRSKKPLSHWGYQYLVMFRKKPLHGPGTGRGPEYIDANGLPSHERVLFETEAEALAAVESYSSGSRKNPVSDLGELAQVRRVVDTRKLREGDDIPGIGRMEDGDFVTYHVTDNPDRVLRVLRSRGKLMAAYGEAGKRAELGPGLYTSGNPSYWLSRATGKWSFLSTLSATKRASLIVALRHEMDRMRGRWISSSEYDRAERDLDLVSEGVYDANSLVQFAGQPYNIAFWKPSFLKPLGIEPGRSPTVLEIRVAGKLVEVDRSWPDAKTLRLLRRSGVVGVYTTSSMSTNPELVIWDSRAVRDVRVESPLDT